MPILRLLTRSHRLRVPVRSIFTCQFITFFRICNTICTSKQWSPELDLSRVDALHNSAQEKLEARDAQARELKYTCFPCTRPPGWTPQIVDDIDTGGEGYAQGEIGDHEDSEYLHGPPVQKNLQSQLSQRFETHLQETEAGANPRLEALFGRSLVERLKARSVLLQERRPRGRPKKSEKSASGSRLPSGQLAQQLDGMTLARLDQSIPPLKGLKARVGGALTVEALVANNVLAGRLQVCYYIFLNIT